MRAARLRMDPEANANTIFIEKRKKVSTLYIKSLRWYDLKLDAAALQFLLAWKTMGKIVDYNLTEEIAHGIYVSRLAREVARELNMPE